MTKLKQFIPKHLTEANENQQYEIYCDMDGVLTDFDKQFGSISRGAEPEQYEKENGTKRFWVKVGSAGIAYWSEMPWMPEAKSLWHFIKPYGAKILTAPSRSSDCVKGKRMWTTRELGGSTEVIINKDKAKYATPNSILIDDRAKNINAWKSAGGIGILHKSPSDTIAKLKKILSQ